MTIDDLGQDTQRQVTRNTQAQKNGTVRTVERDGESEVGQINNTVILLKTI